MYNQIPYLMPNYAAPAAASLGAKTSLFSKLSIGSILTNAQKTLNVVNQAIPLYYQVKPVFKNFKTIGKIGKELTRMNNTSTNNIENNEVNKVSNNEIEESNNIPNPSFFL